MKKLLVIIKPEIVAHHILRKAAINELTQKGIAIEEMKMMRIGRNLAEKLYQQHRGKFFYNRLVRHITSGEVLALRVTGNPREFIGSSRLWPRLQVQPLRQQIALSDVRNVAHASDEDAADAELQLFF